MTARERGAHADFFALLGFLERDQNVVEAPIGVLTTRPERIRLRHDPSFCFPTADVSTLTIDTLGIATVTSAFLGLTGATTPLAEHLIEGWSQDPESAGLQALFDVWHHRLLGLLYRSVIRYSPAQTSAQDGQDAWSLRLAAWTPDTQAVPLSRRLRITQHACHPAPSAVHLRAMVQDLCADDVPAQDVRLETLCGGWQPLCQTQWMHLGHAQSRLGQDAIVGQSVQAPASAFCVHIGPLSKRAWARLSTPAWQRELAALLSWFTPQGVQAQVVLTLSPDALPQWPAHNARLGGDTWLGRPRHNTTLRLTLEEHEAF